MKNLFGDLDQLIEQAVAKATNTEKSLQKKQADAIKDRGIKAEETDEKKDEVEEADDDEKEKSGDESVKKIKGKESGEAPNSSKKPDDKKTDEVPGTKTSKKLDNPPEKVLTNPQFSDIEKKVNALRGSGSLKDEKVAGAVKDYLANLSKAEKSALLTYLTNLAQIMATVKSPKDVNDPGKVGIKTTFGSKKKGGSEKSVVPSSEKKSDVIVVGGK